MTKSTAPPAKKASDAGTADTATAKRKREKEEGETEVGVTAF